MANGALNFLNRIPGVQSFVDWANQDSNIGMRNFRPDLLPRRLWGELSGALGALVPESLSNPSATNSPTVPVMSNSGISERGLNSPSVFHNSLLHRDFNLNEMSRPKYDSLGNYIMNEDDPTAGEGMLGRSGSKYVHYVDNRNMLPDAGSALLTNEPTEVPFHNVTSETEKEIANLPWAPPKGAGKESPKLPSTAGGLNSSIKAIEDYLYPGGIDKTDPKAKTLFGMPISDDDINYALIMGGLGMASAAPGQSPIQAMSQGAMGGMQALGQSARARKKLQEAQSAKRANVLTTYAALAKAQQGKSEFERLVAIPKEKRSPGEQARIDYLTTKKPAVTVDASAKPFAKVSADRYEKIINQGDFGRHLSRGIDRFESALNEAQESGERTGPFAAAAQSVVAIGNEFNFDVARAMANKGFSNLSQLTGEKLEKARTELGLQLASVLLAGQGQVTENERAEVRRLVGGLGTSMEGNRNAIKGLRAMANDRINRRNAAEAYLNMLEEQGKKPTLRGFDKYYDEEYGASSNLALTTAQMQDLVTKAGGMGKLKVYLGRNPTNSRARRLYETLVGPLP